MNNENYIALYYQKIKNGDVIVGKWVEALYEKIIHGIENGEFVLSLKKAKQAVLFIENFVRHHEGALAPQKLKLELWQKALLSIMFGIVDEDGNRHFREFLIITARKNGKTLLASAIAAYCAFLDGEYGGRVYFSAPKLEQANLCFDAFCQIIYKEPQLDQLSKKRRTDIYIESSNTTAKPLAFNAKKSDGLNISLAICDEVASWAGAGGLKFYEVLKSSVGSRKQPLIVSITTAGYEDEGVFDELFVRSTRYLKGDSKESRLCPILYTIDDPHKWNDISELQKSNPNLGVSVTTDYLLEEIAVAEGSLSKKAEFLTKYCNIKQNSSVAWLPAVSINNARRAPLSFEDFRNCYAVGGIDLSRTTDLTACICVIERGGILHVFAKFFMPAEKLAEATARDGLPYSIYIQRGILQLSGDNFVDYKDCAEWFKDLIAKYKIYPLMTGFDRYSSQYLVQNMKEFGFQMDDVFQGYNLTPVIREFEGLLKDGKIDIGDNDLLKVHLLNTALKTENDTERSKIVKLNNKSHIDGTAALLDAFCVRQKYWKEIGVQLQNNGR